MKDNLSTSFHLANATTAENADGARVKVDDERMELCYELGAKKAKFRISIDMLQRTLICIFVYVPPFNFWESGEPIAPAEFRALQSELVEAVHCFEAFMFFRDNSGQLLLSQQGEEL